MPTKKVGGSIMKQEEKINTKEMAAFFRVDAQTIRRGLCVCGHYMGIRPKKLANGRLLWPKVEVLRVLGMEN